MEIIIKKINTTTLKRILFAAITCLIFSFSIIAQHPQRGGKGQMKREILEEKIKSMKIAFITEKLNLTPEEAEKFWPIYNQMEAERNVLFSEKKGEFDNASNDKDAQAYIIKHFEVREKEIALERRSVERLKSILPQKKIAKLLFIEKQFRQEIMANIIQKARENRGKG